MGRKQRSVLGQNFLADTAARRRIVEALGPGPLGDIVEIGPGKAALTDLLAERARRLLAVEVDPALASALRARFARRPSVEIVEADVLQVDFTGLAHEPGRSLAVLGNLPYYITSPILGHLFAHEARLSRAVVMVQREVAERMAAFPGTRDYGLLSVLCQVHARVELLFTLPPEAFSPPPAVDSAVVRMEFAPRWAELAVEPAAFRWFLSCAFAQKRKTLGNNLRAAGYAPGYTTDAISAALPSPTAAMARAEELTPEELAAVYRSLAPPRSAALI